MGKKRDFYCQRQIEGLSKCDVQCEHCKEYYKPLETYHKSKKVKNFDNIRIDIAEHLLKIDYDDDLLAECDLSDIGNEIGIAISKYLMKRKMGYTKDDFIRGIKHGISLMDGTHP